MGSFHVELLVVNRIVVCTLYAIFSAHCRNRGFVYSVVPSFVYVVMHVLLIHVYACAVCAFCYVLCCMFCCSILSCESRDKLAIRSNFDNSR